LCKLTQFIHFVQAHTIYALCASSHNLYTLCKLTQFIHFVQPHTIYTLCATSHNLYTYHLTLNNSLLSSSFMLYFCSFCSCNLTGYFHISPHLEVKNKCISIGTRQNLVILSKTYMMKERK
jgi:hypothetical protein